MANEFLRQKPVNGIVQPPIEPMPGCTGRWTNQLKYLQEKVVDLIIRKNSLAEPFLQPVDAKKLNLPDYHKKIKRPMNLLTVQKRLENRYYFSSQGAIADLNLVFDNCCAYNKPNDEIVLMAQKLKQIVDGKIKKMAKKEIELKPSKATSGKSVTFDPNLTYFAMADSMLTDANETIAGPSTSAKGKKERKPPTERKTAKKNLNETKKVTETVSETSETPTKPRGRRKTIKPSKSAEIATENELIEAVTVTDMQTNESQAPTESTTNKRKKPATRKPVEKESTTTPAAQTPDEEQQSTTPKRTTRRKTPKNTASSSEAIPSGSDESATGEAADASEQDDEVPSNDVVDIRQESLVPTNSRGELRSTVTVDTALVQQVQSLDQQMKEMKDMLQMLLKSLQPGKRNIANEPDNSNAPPSKRPRTNGSLKREIEIDSSEDERETNSPVVRTEEANNEETPQATTANGTDAVERSISTTAEQSAALDPLKDFLIACTDEVRVKAITAMKEHDPSLEDSHTGVVHLDLSKVQPSTVEILQSFVSKHASDSV